MLFPDFFAILISIMNDIVSQTRTKMQKAFEVMQQDFGTVRTGKAHPALIENVTIMAYGGSTPLKLMELATIHAQDASTLVITPFDKSIMNEIEKGLTEANLGMNPIVDESVIRLSIPPLTEERRKEFIKLVNQKAENGRIMIRQARHEAMEDLKKMGEEHVSEDEIKRLEKEIQKVTDEFMEKIDTLRAEKEKELMTL